MTNKEIMTFCSQFCRLGVHCSVNMVRSFFHTVLCIHVLCPYTRRVLVSHPEYYVEALEGQFGLT